MRLVFVTDRKDSHAERFSEAFAATPFDYTWLLVDTTMPGGARATWDDTTLVGWEAIREALNCCADTVVSGPLDFVTAHLAGIHCRHIGISWATDVMISAGQTATSLRSFLDTARSLDSVVTDNLATENSFVAAGVSPETILRIPWGPDTSRDPMPDRERFGLPSEVPLVLFGRSLDAHYEPLMFVNALEHLRESGQKATFCLLERGNLVEEVKEAVGSRGLTQSVVWLPELSPDEFTQMLASFDCVVSSSVTDGTSVTVLEAMRAKVPVVGTLTNGLSEWIVEGVTGWLSPIGDSAALALAIQRALSVTADHRNMVTANARRLVDQRAGWEQGVARLIETLKDSPNSSN